MKDHRRRPVPLREVNNIGPLVRESFSASGLVNQNAPTVDPETALVMPEFDADDDDSVQGRSSRPRWELT
jgi:hypothetical protein